jgi:hypothetical protein
MDYEQVYYVTDDGRNARAPVVIDRMRVPRPTSVITSAPPAAPIGMWPPTAAASYQYPQPSFLGPAMMPQGWIGYPTQPGYVVPPPVTPGSNLATILGGFGDVGTLANILAQVFAALLPLPAAPTPQDNSTSENDPAANAMVNSSNLIRYQSALALFARRDQQILTLGSVLKELFKRPGMVTG